MPTTDRRVSASDYSSNSSSPFATDFFRTIGVLVDLHPSMPIIVSMLSTYASLLLMVTLSLYFCDVITQEQHRLAYLNVLHMFDFQRSCAKNLSSFSRFPTLSKSSTRTTTMREFFNVAPFFTKQPGSDSNAWIPNPALLSRSGLATSSEHASPYKYRATFHTIPGFQYSTSGLAKNGRSTTACKNAPEMSATARSTSCAKPNTSAILVAVTDSVAAKSEARYEIRFVTT